MVMDPQRSTTPQVPSQFECEDSRVRTQTVRDGAVSEKVTVTTHSVLTLVASWKHLFRGGERDQERKRTRTRAAGAGEQRR